MMVPEEFLVEEDSHISIIHGRAVHQDPTKLRYIPIPGKTSRFRLGRIELKATRVTTLTADPPPIEDTAQSFPDPVHRSNAKVIHIAITLSEPGVDNVNCQIE